MKKYFVFVFVLCLFFPTRVIAGRGCCSHHGGVCGCSKYGKQVCCDNSLSPSCYCTPPQVYGCTDYKANNYNSEANVNDGSCTYNIPGCTDPNANNYNSEANQDNGSCTYDVYGCTDYKAINYNYQANKDNGSCEYEEKNDAVTRTGNNKNDSYSNESEDGSNDVLGTIGGLIISGLAITGVVKYKKNKNKK